VLAAGAVCACSPLLTSGVHQSPSLCANDQQHYLAAWPLPPPTSEQTQDVRECDFESLAAERYSGSWSVTGLDEMYAPETGCDWAVLAATYIGRINEDDPVPEIVQQSLEHLLHSNAAFVMVNPIFYPYFGRVGLVQPPPFTDHAITDVEISYDWTGLGERVHYIVEISEADSDPQAIIRPARSAFFRARDVDMCLVQALGPALSDLVPVDSQFSLRPCTDNSPEWTVVLTFADSTTVELTTNGSNFLSGGGPWQTNIDGQNYVQCSATFLEALGDIIKALDLPWGQPAGMTCFQREEVFGLAFP
jgi:hypothetical protein